MLNRLSLHLHGSHSPWAVRTTTCTNSKAAQPGTKVSHTAHGCVQPYFDPVKTPRKYSSTRWGEELYLEPDLPASQCFHLLNGKIGTRTCMPKELCEEEISRYNVSGSPQQVGFSGLFAGCHGDVTLISPYQAFAHGSAPCRCIYTLPCLLPVSLTKM